MPARAIMAGSGLDVDSVIERLLSVRGQPNNRTVQLAEGEIRALCATARCVAGETHEHDLGGLLQPAFFFLVPSQTHRLLVKAHGSSLFFGAQTRVVAERRQPGAMQGGGGGRPARARQCGGGVAVGRTARLSWSSSRSRRGGKGGARRGDLFLGTWGSENESVIDALQRFFPPWGGGAAACCRRRAWVAAAARVGFS